MDDLVKNILLVTFVLSIAWKNSESYSLYQKIYNEDDHRVRRQTEENFTCIKDLVKFKCTNGSECVDIELQCDGIEDCPDGSDEHESICSNFLCPEYLFECGYGACLDMNKKCDGKKHCKDGSDEENCRVVDRVTTICRSNQFQCDNGQCIQAEGKCNGFAECDDKSDETENLCFNIFCPRYSYKCKYGACVDRSAECDGIQQCIDNSDEDENKCKVLEPVLLEPGVIGKKCITPLQPEHGKWVYLSDGKKGTPNIPADTNTVITFSCQPGYKISSTIESNLPMLCGAKGKWSVSVMPTCQKLCPSLFNTPLITISCKNEYSNVPCDKATDDTILTYKCAPYYEPPQGRPKSNTCFDGSWDFTPECIPVCGEKRVSATPLIVNGVEVKRGHYPWVVALYSSKDTDPYFTNICGGSLISVEIVLTAAHCVTKKETGRVYPVRYFRVAAGKYYKEYGDPNDYDTAQYSEVAQIVSHREYRGEIQNFRGDIALILLKTPFAFSKVVQPVCYNNLPPVEPHKYGVVTGWGYTTSSGEPSDTLKELELPYNPDEQCLKDLDEDFARRYFTIDKLCAGFNNQNTSVCKGDSGGGLVFKNPYYKQRYFIHGIVSLAHSYTEDQMVRCNIQRSALFTKVEVYTEWIQLKVRQWIS